MRKRMSLWCPYAPGRRTGVFASRCEKGALHGMQRVRKGLPGVERCENRPRESAGMLGSVGRRRGDSPKKLLRGRVFRGCGENPEGGRRGVWRGPWGEFTCDPSGGPYGDGAAAAAKIEIRPIRNGQCFSAGKGNAGGRKAGALRGHALSDCRAARLPER